MEGNKGFSFENLDSRKYSDETGEVKETISCQEAIELYKKMEEDPKLVSPKKTAEVMDHFQVCKNPECEACYFKFQ